MGIKLTTEQFIQKAKAVHGNMYDYSKTEYIGYDTKMVFICPIHGEFKQTRYTHLSGHGCRQCAYKKQTLSIEKFIKRGKAKFGDKYDYSKSVYVNEKTKVSIVCPIHGEFKKYPKDHTRQDNTSGGCPKCHGAYQPTTNEFIKRAKQIHGNRYDYSKVKYRGRNHKVLITCNIHGDFWQTPAIHYGSRCPECAKNLVSEPLFREVLEKIFIDKFSKEYKFPNTRPEWLRNPETGWPLELDCYNEELDLAFELQGRQHYEPIKHFGGEKRYIKQYRRDLWTRDICYQKGVTLFAIDNRPVYGKGLFNKQKYYEQEILKCLTKVPEKIKIKLLEGYGSQQ